MSKFNAHQPEQNSKASLVEAWQIAHDENVRLSKRVSELEEERDAFYCRHVEEDGYISQILESADDYIDFLNICGGRNHLIMAKELVEWCAKVEQLKQSPISRSLEKRDLEQQAKGIEDAVKFFKGTSSNTKVYFVDLMNRAKSMRAKALGKVDI